MTTRLAVCVDDLGADTGVLGAVLALADAGRISAASCMVGGPAWRETAAALRAGGARGIDLGLHLDFTGFPLPPEQAAPLRTVVLRAYLNRLDLQRVRAQIRAQFDAFEDTLGRPVDHVDGHQHVHQLPGIREALLEELARRPGPRPWLRSTRHAPGLAFKPRLLQALGQTPLAQRARAAGYVQNRRLLGVYDFGGDALRYRARLRQWLAVAQDGDLLMCHPSAGAGDAADAIRAARQHEYAVLAGADFDALLAEAGCSIVPLRTVPAGQPAPEWQLSNR